TGKEQSIRIEASSGLSEAEIQQLVKDAEAHASEDKTRKEEVETRNRGDAFVYEIEKNLKEHGDKLDADTRSRVDKDLEALREALKGQDTAAIRSATESLEKTWHVAASAMYKAAGPPPGADAAG